jgi:hypothetical protein
MQRILNPDYIRPRLRIREWRRPAGAREANGARIGPALGLFAEILACGGDRWENGDDFIHLGHFQNALSHSLHLGQS